MKLAICFFASLLAITNAAKSTAPPRNQLLLISFDGFRWDYLTKFNLDLVNFKRLESRGVTTRGGGNIPPFFTYTFPSHYTAVTGLYEESHGIVGNKFYDPVMKKTFSMYRQDFDPRWWNGGEPIWVTTRKHNLTSATYFWPGSEVEIRGYRPSEWKPYNESSSFEDRVEQSLDWLERGIDLVCSYFSEPDHTGHEFGPNSIKVAQQVKRMDHVLGLFLDGLEKRKLTSKVNLLLTSDHGMTNIWPNQSISLDNYIDVKKDIKLVTYGPAAFIRPKNPEKTLEIYQKLRGSHPNMTVYLKEDIPERWHYKHNRRISPIFATADEGWYINGTGWRPFPISRDTNKPLGGMHGYDNLLPSMQPIFFAAGPDIAVDTKVTPFETVNYYLLMCRLLGIPPSANNGTLTAIRNVFASSAEAASSTIDSPRGFLEPGPCPKALPIATFDADEFSGDWFMISFKPNMMESKDLKCRKMNFRVDEDNNIVMTSTDADHGQIKTMTRDAKWDPKNGGLMSMTQMGMTVPYSILSTDYTSSAASWSCVEMFGMHAEVEWLWSRTSTLDAATKTQLTKMMKNAGIKVEEMIDVQC